MVTVGIVSRFTMQVYHSKTATIVEIQILIDINLSVNFLLILSEYYNYLKTAEYCAVFSTENTNILNILRQLTKIK